jgi:hypothetical protein
MFEISTTAVALVIRTRKSTLATTKRKTEEREKVKDLILIFIVNIPVTKL